MIQIYVQVSNGNKKIVLQNVLPSPYLAHICHKSKDKITMYVFASQIA